MLPNNLAWRALDLLVAQSVFPLEIVEKFHFWQICNSTQTRRKNIPVLSRDGISASDSRKWPRMIGKRSIDAVHNHDEIAPNDSKTKFIALSNLKFALKLCIINLLNFWLIKHCVDSCCKGDFLSVYELYDVQHCLRPGSLDLSRVTTQSIVLVMLQANWTDARIRVLSEDLFCYIIASRIFILFARTAMSTFGVQASLTRCSHSFHYVTGTGQARPVLGLIKLHAVQLRIVYLIPCSQLLFA